MRILKGQAARASTHAAAELEAGRARILGAEPEVKKAPVDGTPDGTQGPGNDTTVGTAETSDAKPEAEASADEPKPENRKKK